MKQSAVRNLLSTLGRPFNEVVIRRRNVLRNLAQDLTAPKGKRKSVILASDSLTPELVERWGLNNEWSVADRRLKYTGQKWAGKGIFGSPLVDIAATKELAMETVEMCEMILRLTNLDIRLLSKSPLLESVVAVELAKRLPDAETGAKARVIFGFSTGTLRDEVARAIEGSVPSPSTRFKALHRLHPQLLAGAGNQRGGASGSNR